MEDKKHWLGRWAVSHSGKLGRIDEITEAPRRSGYPYLYKGVAIDGSEWQSIGPMVLTAKQSKIVNAMWDFTLSMSMDM